MTTTTMTHKMLTILATLLMSATLTACLGGGGGSDCDPALDEACVCEDLDGLTCDDPDALDCLCLFEDEALGLEEEAEDDDYRFVLIEDLTDPIGGDAPGADIDAVGLIKEDGTEFFATAVEESQIGEGRNAYRDVNALLGAPDSECEKKNFVSLGGLNAGGYAMVSFATEKEDVIIANGDSIHVYEIGASMCPGTPFDNDPYKVSVSVSDELGTFIEVGSGGDGDNIIPVTGL